MPASECVKDRSTSEAPAHSGRAVSFGELSETAAGLVVWVQSHLHGRNAFGHLPDEGPGSEEPRRARYTLRRRLTRTRIGRDSPLGKGDPMNPGNRYRAEPQPGERRSVSPLRPAS